MSVVVLGAGIDELVAAHLLARRGRKVTLLASREGDAGEGALAPRVAAALGLRHASQAPDPWVSGSVELWRDVQRSAESIARLSARDAARWPQFCERVGRVAAFLEALYLAPPPDPLSTRFALRARRLGRQGLTDLMRFLPKSAAELLDDWFESDALKGLLGALAVPDLQQGVRSGGTAFSLVHANVGNPPGVFRPAAGVPRQALEQGLEIRRGEAAQIVVRAGRVAAVALAGGEELAADEIVSGLGPRRTLTELVDTAWLDPELVRAVRHIRCRSVAARIALELDRAAPFGSLVIAPSLDYVEKAYDHSKYGQMSPQPVVYAHSVEGKRLLVELQYVPRTHGDAAAVERLASDMVSPHLGGAQVRQAKTELPGQRVPYAELTLDQALWMRPLADLSRYRTPLAGLWLNGPSMHPGPGFGGAAGYNCAREMLRG
ncbi:MAG: phytoene desaturase family protein [Betaproteobacteria bacterium]